MKYPWIAWYPAEYISKTRSLTMKQHGAYCLLLWEYYTNGPLLANASGLLNVCCSRTEEDREDVATILKTFFFLEGGFWHHKRADEEIKKRGSISKQRQLIGRKGGLAKATRLLQQKPTQSQSQSHIQEDLKLLDPGKSLEELNSSSGGKSVREKFRAPTREETWEFCKEAKIQIDANAWFDYYEANGWKVGRNPMKDWKACVRYWSRSGGINGNGRQQTSAERNQQAVIDANEAASRTLEMDYRSTEPSSGIKGTNRDS